MIFSLYLSSCPEAARPQNPIENSRQLPLFYFLLEGLHIHLLQGAHTIIRGPSAEPARLHICSHCVLWNRNRNRNRNWNYNRNPKPAESPKSRT